MRHFKLVKALSVPYGVCAAVFLGILLATGFQSYCQADPAQQTLKTPAAAESKWADNPVSYSYTPENGTIDDQARAAISAQTRAAAIASHGRSSNAGMYAVAALLLACAGLLIWRRARANA